MSSPALFVILHRLRLYRNISNKDNETVSVEI